jgi:uncharacterized protein (TIGR00251 family)
VITRLSVRVQPGARREALVGWLADGTLKLAVAAPPEGGRANRAVEALLAAALGLRARQVTVRRGATSRAKTVEIEGLAPEEVQRRLAARLGTENADGE